MSWGTGTAERQPTLTIIEKVTVSTRTIDLNVLLGGGTDDSDGGMGIGDDVAGFESLLNFSVEPLPFKLLH